MKKQFRIATFGLIAAAALTLGLRSTVAQTAQTVIPGKWLTVVNNCTGKSGHCNWDQEAQAWVGGYTITTGTEQTCQPYADGDGCTVLGCTGTTTTAGCP
jgi:hypothetical protein